MEKKTKRRENEDYRKRRIKEETEQRILKNETCKQPHMVYMYTSPIPSTTCMLPSPIPSIILPPPISSTMSYSAYGSSVSAAPTALHHTQLV